MGAVLRYGGRRFYAAFLPNRRFLARPAMGLILCRSPVFKYAAQCRFSSRYYRPARRARRWQVGEIDSASPTPCRSRRTLESFGIPAGRLLRGNALSCRALNIF